MKKAALKNIANVAFSDPDDVEFLEHICERFPHIGDRLLKLASESPQNRFDAAWQMLKETPRRGILEMGVPPEAGESVQDHTRHCMDLVPMLAEPEDTEHLVSMMHVHDLAEAVTGDFTPRDNIAKTDKHRLERIVFNVMLEGNSDKDRIIGLWEEYERNETARACLAHDIDKIDLALTAQEYMREFPGLRHALHSEFVAPMKHWLHTDGGRAFFETVRAHPRHSADKREPRVL